jgi:uncharacterized protein YndB with AHSA1/START domain
MKKLLKVIGVIVLLVVAFVLIAGLFAKKEYHFEKDIIINAPREKVWDHVNTLRTIDQWNPFKEKDPNIQTTYTGEDGAIGSSYAWKGNKDVGEGTQTITKIDKPGNVTTHLHFIKPFDGQAEAFINLADAGNGTKVTWGFDTKYPYPMNTMMLFMNMDDMMGKEYSAGLAKLKALCE